MRKEQTGGKRLVLCWGSGLFPVLTFWPLNQTGTAYLFFYWSIVDLQEKAMAPHSSTLAWKIPWTEETGGLWSMGSWRAGHDWATSLSLFTFTRWRRKRQPTPVFLPGESQGRGSLVGCRLWGHRVRHDWRDLAAAAAVDLQSFRRVTKQFSYVCVCVCVCVCVHARAFFFRFFSIIGYYKILNIVPCAIQ